MKQFQIFRYLKKWRFLIAALMVAGGIGFMMYAQDHQSYTAQVTIRYTNAGASEGKQPDGSTLDVSDIFSSRVINGVLHDLEINSNIEGIRSRCSVSEIIPEDQETLKKALLEQGKEYTYYPTDYTVYYTAGASSSAESARRILSSVLDNYFNSYAENYISESVLPNNASNLVDSAYDYLEQIDLIDQSVSDTLSLLNRKGEQYSGFRSARTGYSFQDLSALYQYLADNAIPYLYAKVLDGAVTKDAEVLKTRYQERISRNEQAYENAKERLANVASLIEEYGKKLAEGLSPATNDADPGTGGKTVLQSVYDNTHSANMTITYDQLVALRVQYEAEMKNLEISKAHDQNILGIYQDAKGGKNAELDEKIADVISELGGLHDIFAATYDEFNDYLVAQNVCVLSNINVEQGLNIKLYLVLTIVVFFVCGCIGAVVLGRGEDILEYVIYNDPQTGLPNRARCDKEIAKHSGVLPDSFCCVLIMLDSLHIVNDKAGYGAGNAQLRELALLIKSVTHDLGFVGYNGAGQYLCLFDACTVERADSILDQLRELVKRYNAEHETLPMRLSAAVVSTTDDKLYAIKPLVISAHQRLHSMDI